MPSPFDGPIVKKPVGLLYRALNNIRPVGTELFPINDFFTIPGVVGPGSVLYRLTELPLNVPVFGQPQNMAVDCIQVDPITHIPLPGPIHLTAITQFGTLVPGSFVIKSGTSDIDDTFKYGQIRFSQGDAGSCFQIIYTGRGSLVFASDVLNLNSGLSLLPGTILPAHLSVDPTDNFYFPNDVNIAGNMNVAGVINKTLSTILDAEDETILLNAPHVGDPTAPWSLAASAGLEVYRGVAQPQPSLLWTETPQDWQLTGGPLVIGQTILGSLLTVAADAMVTVIQDESALPDVIGVGILYYSGGANNDGAIFAGRMANGSQASPTATLLGNNIARFTGVGFDGTNYADHSASVIIQASENVTPTACGSDLLFRTTLNTTTNEVEVVRFTNSGLVGIGTANVAGNPGPQGMVNVIQDNTSQIRQRSFLSLSYDSTGQHGGHFAGGQARGTAGAPAQTQAGDIMAQMSASGFFGDTLVFSAQASSRIQFIASEAQNSTSAGTHISFSTTPIGSPTSSRREIARLTAAGQLAVGTSTPAVSALVDFTSTTLGFAGPRMTQAQRDAIISPTEGLELYNLDTHKKSIWNGSAWVDLGSGGGGGGVEVRQDFVASSGQTAFSLTGGHTYTLGSGDLEVYLNGDLQTVGAGNDYQETNNTTITFNNPQTAGEAVTLVLFGSGGGGGGGGNQYNVLFPVSGPNGFSSQGVSVDNSGNVTGDWEGQISITGTFSGGNWNLVLTGEGAYLGTNGTLTATTFDGSINGYTGTWSFAGSGTTVIDQGIVGAGGPHGSSPFNQRVAIWQQGGFLYYDDNFTWDETNHRLGIGTGTTAPTTTLQLGGVSGVDGIKFPDGTLQTSAATAGITQLTADVLAGPGVGSQSATVVALRGKAIDPTFSPSNGQVLTWDGTSNWWYPATPSGGGGLTGGAAGEVVFMSAPSVYSFTAAGTTGQLLTSAGTGTPTWTTASSSDVASAVVQRDGSGNFVSNQIESNQWTDNIVSGTVNSSPYSFLGTQSVQKLTLNFSATFQIFGAMQPGQAVTLLLLQGAGGGFTVNWTSIPVRWPGGTAPTLTTTAGKTDFITIFYDGTNYYGFVGGQNF